MKDEELKEKILKIVQEQYDLDPRSGWILKPKYGAMSLPATIKEIMFLVNKDKYYKKDKPNGK